MNLSKVGEISTNIYSISPEHSVWVTRNLLVAVPQMHISLSHGASYIIILRHVTSASAGVSWAKSVKTRTRVSAKSLTWFFVPRQRDLDGFRVKINRCEVHESTNSPSGFLRVDVIWWWWDVWVVQVLQGGGEIALGDVVAKSSVAWAALSWIGYLEISMLFFGPSGDCWKIICI